MIHYRGKDIIAIRYVENGIETVFTALHVGIETVWQAVRSCFGSGNWIDSKPWIDNENWKD